MLRKLANIMLAMDSTSSSTRLPLLYTVSAQGHDDVVDLLLAAGADPDKVLPTNGRTPLYVAAAEGHCKVVKLLLGAGADIDKATTDNGCTPLFIAAQEGHDKVVAMLLAAGANKNQATTDDGCTPLFIAAQEGRDEVVAILLDAGADKDKPTTDDRCTALFIASQLGHVNIVNLLLRVGADKESVVGRPRETAALVAAYNGHREALLLLLRAGACPRADDTTVLHEAARMGHIQVVDDIITMYPTSKRWYAFLMSINAATQRPEIPLARRSSASKLYTQDLLFHIRSFLRKPRYFADIDYLDDTGCTAAELAQHGGHDTIVALLFENGATKPQQL